MLKFSVYNLNLRLELSGFRGKSCTKHIIYMALSMARTDENIQNTFIYKYEKLRNSNLNQCTVQTFIESEDTRCCVNTIFSPEDGHVNARNMSRIIVQQTYFNE